MLFIVKGKVCKRGYMQDREEVEEVIHPVEAVDENEAREIFENHFESMSNSYDVSYRTSSIEVFETLFKRT